MQTKLKAGIARRIISPPKGIYLIGYGDRTWGNRGVHDDLTATVLVLEDAANRVVILACDLLAINEISLARLKAKSDENIILCCSHTHSGPIVYADKRASRKNKAYLNYLISQLLDAILEAGKNLQPVSLSWASGQADIAVNRRQRRMDGSVEIGVNPDGVVDRSIGIVQIQTLDAKPFANLVNFCCHNVVLGPKNLLVSADWAGAMRRRVELATGVPCLFIQGATADLNPDHEWGNADFEAVEELGKRVAQGVLSGMANFTPFGGIPLIFQEREVWFQLEAAAQTPSPPDAYKNKLSATTGIPKVLVNKLLNIRYPWKTKIEARDGFWSIPMVITSLQIGELMWVGFGAEVFTEIGIKIKASSPYSYNFFSSLTNGCIGYLPTSDEHIFGGYEVDLAPFFYRLPGRLQPDSAEKAYQAVKSYFVS